jgi:hypothetical protein
MGAGVEAFLREPEYLAHRDLQALAVEIISTLEVLGAWPLPSSATKASMAWVVSSMFAARIVNTQS